MHDDPLDDGALFAMKAEPTAFLRDRYQEPPFTVLDRRNPKWIDRDRRWAAIGIQSEVGRDDALTYGTIMNKYSNWYEVRSIAEAQMGRRPTDAEMLAEPWISQLNQVRGNGSRTSIFSPTLAELALRWYSRPGAVVLDPFAGGSVRGIVSGALGRPYTGIELRPEQVESNREQAHLADPCRPLWLEGDSTDIPSLLHDDYMADMILSCPPYAHLEQYSDDPRDLSTMRYPAFLEVYRDIIAKTAAHLRDNRFAVWVVGEVREKGGDGSLVGLIPDTIQAFRDAGLEPYNDHIILTPIGTAAVRTPRQFDASRKAGRIHEYMLVFVKGDAKKATQWLGSVADKPRDAGAPVDDDATTPSMDVETPDVPDETPETAPETAGWDVPGADTPDDDAAPPVAGWDDPQSDPMADVEQFSDAASDGHPSDAYRHDPVSLYGDPTAGDEFPLIDPDVDPGSDDD